MLFDRLLDIRNDVGLLSEEYDTVHHQNAGKHAAGLLACRAHQRRSRSPRRAFARHGGRGDADVGGQSIGIALPISFIFAIWLSSENFASFEEFYPFYLSQHSKPATRAIHAVGTGLGLLNAAKSLVVGPRKQLVLTPSLGTASLGLATSSLRATSQPRLGTPLLTARRLHDDARYGPWPECRAPRDRRRLPRSDGG